MSPGICSNNFPGKTRMATPHPSPPTCLPFAHPRRRPPLPLHRLSGLLRSEFPLQPSSSHIPFTSFSVTFLRAQTTGQLRIILWAPMPIMGEGNLVGVSSRSACVLNPSQLTTTKSRKVWCP